MFLFNGDFDPISEIIAQWNRHIKHLRRICIVIGLLLLGIGILCLIVPQGIFLTIQWIGAAGFILYGIYHLWTYFCMPSYFREPLLVIMGILCLITGTAVIHQPTIITMTTISFMFGMFLLFVGAEKLSRARHLRFYHLMNTAPITISAVFTILVAVFFLFMPTISALTLPYLLAIYLIVSSIALLIEALSMHEIRR